jgi:hypothetical protein
MFKTLGIVTVAIIMIVAVLLGPFAVIWSWNTLFGTVVNIGYTFWTWLAVIVLGAFISPNVRIAKKS